MKKSQRQKIKDYQKRGFSKFYGTDGRVYLAKPGTQFKNKRLIKGRIVRVDAEGESYTATWKFKQKAGRVRKRGIKNEKKIPS